MENSVKLFGILQMKEGVLIIKKENIKFRLIITIRNSKRVRLHKTQTINLIAQQNDTIWFTMFGNTLKCLNFNFKY